MNIVCKGKKMLRGKQKSAYISFSGWTLLLSPRPGGAESKYASSNHGSKILKDLFVDNPFDFPKSVPLVEDCIRASGGGVYGAQVVDFFAGSGTTGHAVVNLNREDNGGRKYVLVEMGDHFDGVLLPRIKKVIHAPDWRNGRPFSREGISGFFKYIRLESYEDTMDSLELASPTNDLLKANPALAEDYRLRYALGVETAGSASLLGSNFVNPFAYTLSVVRDGARQAESADLPETFNYLIGLCVASRRRIDGVLAMTGMDVQNRQCLILWRDLEETDHRALDAWFTRNRPRFPEALDLVYVNGDQTLNAVRQPGETWIAETIEPIFRDLMFADDG